MKGRVGEPQPQPHDRAAGAPVRHGAGLVETPARTRKAGDGNASGLPLPPDATETDARGGGGGGAEGSRGLALSSRTPKSVLSEHDACGGGGSGGSGGEAWSSRPPESVLLLTWPSPFTLEVLRGWAPLLRLGAPSAASLLIEWGGFELNAIMAGHLGIEQLASCTFFGCTSSCIKAEGGPPP